MTAQHLFEHRDLAKIGGLPGSLLAPMPARAVAGARQRSDGRTRQGAGPAVLELSMRLTPDDHSGHKLDRGFHGAGVDWRRVAVSNGAEVGQLLWLDAKS
jgi:hypothetical protein